LPPDAPCCPIRIGRHSQVIAVNEHPILPPTTIRRPSRGKACSPALRTDYVLDEQIGFILRQAYQKHALLFLAYFGDDFTPTQWAAIAKLREVGDCSQNLLGRLTAMDAATIKGVVDRLTKRGYIASSPSPTDRRRVLITLTAAGRKAYERCVGQALRVSTETMARLKPRDRAALLRLLKQLG
jgi:MarR family transcriptional regulator, lower aerobic nicotinate degradation pathway regulator